MVQLSQANDPLQLEKVALVQLHFLPSRPPPDFSAALRCSSDMSLSQLHSPTWQKSYTTEE